MLLYNYVQIFLNLFYFDKVTSFLLNHLHHSHYHLKKTIAGMGSERHFIKLCIIISKNNKKIKNSTTRKYNKIVRNALIRNDYKKQDKIHVKKNLKNLLRRRFFFPLTRFIHLHTYTSGDQVGRARVEAPRLTEFCAFVEIRGAGGGDETG